MRRYHLKGNCNWWARKALSVKVWHNGGKTSLRTTALTWGSNPIRVWLTQLRQNGRHFPDDIFKWIFLNENVWISIVVSLKFVPKCPINNIPSLVQIMAWRRPGDKPLSETMMVNLLTHKCVTNTLRQRQNGHYFTRHLWNTFSRMKRFEILFKFHWNLFPMIQLTINQQWVR